MLAVRATPHLRNDWLARCVPLTESHTQRSYTWGTVERRTVERR